MFLPEWTKRNLSFPSAYTGNKHEERPAVLDGKWSKLKDEDGWLNEKTEREGSAWITLRSRNNRELMAANLSDPPKWHPTGFIRLGAIFGIPFSLFCDRPSAFTCRFTCNPTFSYDTSRLQLWCPQHHSFSAVYFKI